MPILGCNTPEECFALHQAEERRAGRRGEFFDHIRSIPIVPILDEVPSQEEFLANFAPLRNVKMVIHQAMTRPGELIR